MGNQHSNETTKTSLRRSKSANDIQDRTPTHLLPIDKLSKILAQKSLEEDSVQGISCRVLAKLLFPRYPDLAAKLYTFFHSSAGPQKHERLTQTAFKQQAEKLLTIMPDEHQTEVYVRMFAEGDEISQQSFRDLLLSAYRLAMDFYPEGPRTCTQLYKIIQAVVDGAFHRKETVPTQYLAHWLVQHCPRLLVGLHRYVVHILSTAHRSAGAVQHDVGSAGLDLSTPVLDRESPFSDPPGEEVLPVSEAWLLAGTLPEVFTRPTSPLGPAPGGLHSAHTFVAKLLGSMCPSHWVLLYDSKQHGLGANRFTYHVLSYRGPTLTFLRGEEGVQFCVAACSEWRETHQYWGGEDCIVVQILPVFHIVERGPKLLYLNTSIRGYPKGLRAGQDPRSPCISVDEDFSRVTYSGIPYPIVSVEVWGCGCQQSRDAQLEIKKWQVKEAERQRQVKLNARDWMDHPDRYLLELAGRPSYTTS